MDKTKILEKKKQLEKKKELDEIIASDKFFKLVEKDKKEKELNSLMKECIKDWCEDTTSHGFSNMVKTDSWIIRITWIILIIVSMAYCMYSKYFNLSKKYIFIIYLKLVYLSCVLYNHELFIVQCCYELSNSHGVTNRISSNYHM